MVRTGTRMTSNSMGNGTPWFSPALDLSAWMVTRTGASNDSDAAASVPVEDIRNLGEYLRGNDNDLAVVEFRKEVSWPDWEELAVNIKLHRLEEMAAKGELLSRPSM